MKNKNQSNAHTKEILGLIDRRAMSGAGPSESGEIGEALGIHRTFVTGILNRLAKEGRVSRVPSSLTGRWLYSPARAPEQAAAVG